MEIQNQTETSIHNDTDENFFQSLFPKDCHRYKVQLRNQEWVDYVNFDHAATTAPFTEVRDYINEVFDFYGSVHRGSGQKSIVTTELYDLARDRIRRYVKAEPQNYVIYSKNTTESINQAAALWSQVPGKILVSDIEHSSNLLPWVRFGNTIQYRTRPDGTVDLQEMDKILKTEKIKLVTFTACSNITGYCPPIYKVAALAHSYGAMVFADLCQYIPHEEVNMLPDKHPSHLDFIAFSGHKMYAPYGIGVLIGPKWFFDQQMPYHIGGGNLPYITRDLTLKRYFTERAHDPGTPNAIGPLALTKAMDILESIGHKRISQYERKMVHAEYDELMKIKKIHLYVQKDIIGHVIPFDVEGFDPQLVATIMANEFGIGLRAGAFCTYEYIRKLKNISDQEDAFIAAEVDRGITSGIPQIVRISLSIANTYSDCTRLNWALKEMIQKGPHYYWNFYKKDPITGKWDHRQIGSST